MFYVQISLIFTKKRSFFGLNQVPNKAQTLNLVDVILFFKFLCIDFRERGKQHCFVGPLILICIQRLILVCALTRDQTRNLGISGPHSDQLTTRPGQLI